MNPSQDVSKLFELIGRQTVVINGLQSKLMELSAELIQVKAERDAIRAAQPKSE